MLANSEPFLSPVVAFCAGEYPAYKVRGQSNREGSPVLRGGVSGSVPDSVLGAKRNIHRRFANSYSDTGCAQRCVDTIPHTSYISSDVYPHNKVLIYCYNPGS